jgi:hypothetical protein
MLNRFMPNNFRQRHISKKLRSADFAHRIINIIEKRLGALPNQDIIHETGFVAGQSVASAIYTLLGLTQQAPFKDVDIFCDIKDLDDHDLVSIGYASDYRYEAADKDYEFHTSLNFGEQLARGGYTESERSLNQIKLSGDYAHIEKAGYRINAVGTGKHNPNIEIILLSANRSSRERKWATILAGFDINAICCGIDLFTKRLYFTEAFEQFLYRSELKATTYYTPSKTACRLIKKERELDFVTLDTAWEMSRIQDVIEMLTINEQTLALGYQYTPGNIFGSASENRLLVDNEQALSAYFTRETIDVNLQVGNGEENTQQFVTLRANTSRKHITKDIIAPYYNMQKYLGQLTSRVEEYVSDVSALMNWSDYAGKRGAHQLACVAQCIVMFEECKDKDKRKHHNQYPMLAREFAQGLIEGTIIFQNPRHISKTIKLLKGHSNLWSEIKASINGRYGMSEKEVDIYQFTQLLFKAIGKRRYLIGHIEQYGSLLAGLLKEAHVTGDISQNIDLIDSALLSKLKDQVVSPVADTAITTFKSRCDSIEVKELCSAIDLMIEGEEQSHCVGGYFNAIQSRERHIFSLRRLCEKGTTLERATLEVVPQNGQYRIHQLWGKYNTSVSKVMEKMCLHFCGVMGDTLPIVAKKGMNYDANTTREIPF